jgi:hypothetical protein
MKKILLALTSLYFFCFAFTFPTYAAGSTIISLNPSSSMVRIGDTITITGKLSGNISVGAFDINVIYNAGQLKFKSAAGIEPAINSKELDFVDNNGSLQLIYLNDTGIIGGIQTANAFKLTFSVIGGNVGDTISTTTQVTFVSDLNTNAVQTSSTPATMKIAAPLSSNIFLGSLSINSGTLTPAFSKNVLSYSVSVTFSVSKLNVTTTAEDINSKVTVNSPELIPNATTDVTVTVTAQTGVKKIYTIKVTRAQDPNYKASSNNSLSGITLNLGILSPVFKPEIKKYVVWLPYETDKIEAIGIAQDSKASVQTTGGNNLIAGKDNEIMIICTAENGDKSNYVVVAKRAAANNTKAQSTISVATNSNPNSSSIPLALTVALLIIFTAIGFGGGAIIFRKR